MLPLKKVMLDILEAQIISKFTYFIGNRYLNIKNMVQRKYSNIFGFSRVYKYLFKYIRFSKKVQTNIQKY